MPFLTVPEEQSVETPNRALQSYGLDAVPSSSSEVFSATSDAAWASSPLPYTVRWLDRGRMRMNNKGVEDLSADDANALYGVDDKQAPLKFDAPVPETTASQLSTLKREELQRRNVISRRQGGALETAGMFGVGLATSAIDPLNLASAFIPVVGEARFGLWAAKYGATGARLARGAAEGFVGAAVTEPLVFAAAHQEQADYHLTDSLLNLTFGTAIGGGLHMGLGRLGDAIAGHQLQEPALRGAVANLIDDRPVRIDAFLRDKFLEGAQYDTTNVLRNVRSFGGRDVRDVQFGRSPEDFIRELVPEEIRNPTDAPNVTVDEHWHAIAEAARNLDEARLTLANVVVDNDIHAGRVVGEHIQSGERLTPDKLKNVEDVLTPKPEAPTEFPYVGELPVLRGDASAPAVHIGAYRDIQARVREARNTDNVVTAQQMRNAYEAKLKNGPKALEQARRDLLKAHEEVAAQTQAYHEAVAAARVQSQEALWRQVQEMSRVDYMTPSEKAEVAGIEDIVARSASQPAKAGETASAADAGAIAEDLAHLEGIIAQMEKSGTAPDAVKAYRDTTIADQAAAAREKGFEAAANCQILRGAA